MSPRTPRGPLVVLGLVAVVLLAVGRPTGAAIAVLAAAFVAQAGRLAPDRLRRVEERFTHGVGAVVSVILLVPVFVLIVIPVALGARLLGLDPLRAVGSWRALPGRRRPSHTFGDDRFAGAGRSRWRPAIALVAVGALVATVVPPLFDDDENPIPVRLRADSGFNAMQSPALADAAWADEASVEFTQATVDGSTYVPFVSFASQDYEGRYVNLHDRQRRSYETHLTDQDPLDVWFFGGSTMFGFSAQRDEHTIPSEVVRLAEEDGIAVRAHNFGGPGMVNFQETILFSQLVLAGERPDLVVFYDGVNDRAIQLLHAYGGLGRLGEVSDIGTYAVRQTLAGQLTGNADPPPPVGDLPPVGPPPPPDQIVDAILDVYGQGLHLARTLAEDAGFPVLHFWQPDMFVKDELVPGEQELLEPLHLDALRFQGMADIAEAARAAIPAGVIDLGDAWDGETQAVLTDQAHTNELGAHLVAAAMYEHLAPELARLAAAR